MRTSFFTLIALCYLIPCTCARAQVLYLDDFEDGNFRNPDWRGDTSDFVVDNGQLSAVSGGRITLSTPFYANADTVLFEMLLEADQPFTTGISAQIDLETSGRLALQIMINRNNNGLIRVYAPALEQFSFLLSEEGEIPETTNAIRLRIRREAGFHPWTILPDRTFYWYLEVDYSGGHDFRREQYYNIEEYLTFSEVSLSGNVKVHLDDLKVYANSPPDTTGPSIYFDQYQDFQEFALFFDDTLSTSGNYLDSIAFSREDLRISSLERLQESGLLVTLDGLLPIRDTFQVYVYNAVDNDGDTIAFQAYDLYYDPVLQPEEGQLVINELMIDPSPPVGLPAAEYVEIYNASNYRLDLGTVEIQSGANPVPLPDDTLGAGGYAVLTRPDNVEVFTDLGIAVLGFPMARLANNGDAVFLKTSGATISSVQYDRSWYNDPLREGDGHSLEYVGLGADAGCSVSWRASLDESGGTPGKQNSIFGNIDTIAPLVTNIIVRGDTVILRFSEEIEPDQLGADLFAVDDGAEIVQVLITGDSSVYLITDIVPNILYTLTVFADYRDCSGNYPVADQKLRFGITTEVAPGDVQINEVLFNPVAGGSDYVELINCSEKLLQIEGWQLLNAQNGSEVSVSVPHFFPPGEYLTITGNPQQLLDYYPDVVDTALVLNSLPELLTVSGNVSLVSNGEVITSFDYSEDQHYPLLPGFQGVSLELMEECQFDSPTWFSAAPEVRHGTPTQPNSRWTPSIFPPEAFYLKLSRTTFSPDGDSFEDDFPLIYGTDRLGYRLLVSVYDMQGRPVKSFPQLDLPLGDGMVEWNGTGDNGRLLNRGTYLLLAEITTPDGSTREQQLTFVLAK